MKIHKSALAALIATLCCGVAISTAFAGTPASAPTSNVAPAAVPQGPGDLSALIASGTLPDLRWPNFTDYRTDVKKFYDQGGNLLAWIQNGKASPQAVAMILLFQQAATKGLNPEDYDASRWDARLAKLQPTAPKPSDSDLAHIDLAMTVSAMRYISDLHIRTSESSALQVRLDGRSQQIRPRRRTANAGAACDGRRRSAGES